MKPGDVITLGQRGWKVVGVFLGGVGQEGVVQIAPRDRTGPVAGTKDVVPMFVPVDIVELLLRLRLSTKGGNSVNHPPHYNEGNFEVIDVIEDWGLGFNDGNAVKYIGRHKHKGSPLVDLEKARWYLEREIQRLKTEES